MDGERPHVPVTWIPAIPAGMTLEVIIHFLFEWYSLSCDLLVSVLYWPALSYESGESK